MNRVMPSTGSVLAAATLAALFALPAGAGAPSAAASELPSGEIAYVHKGSGNSEIYLASTGGGRPRNLTAHPAEDETPAWSPDGKQLVFASTRAGSWDLFVLTLADGSVRQLTSGAAHEFDPAWSPDGSRIAYESTADGAHEVRFAESNAGGGTGKGVESTAAGFSGDPAWTSPSGDLVFESMRPGSAGFDLFETSLSGPASSVASEPNEDFHPAVSPDGSTLAFERAIRGNYDLHLLDRSSGAVSKLTGAKAEDAEPSWSPDGTRLAFTSTRTGDYDVYVLDLVTRQAVNVTRDRRSDDTSPAWRPVTGAPVLPALAARGPFGLRARAAATASCPTRGSYSGTYRRNVIRGRNTADTICARGGNDVVKAGRGNDRLFGGAGRDDLYGQAGNDVIDGGGEAGRGQDRMRGGAGNDVIVGRGDGRRDCAAGNSGLDRARLDRGSNVHSDNRGRAPWGRSPCGDQRSIEADL